MKNLPQLADNFSSIKPLVGAQFTCQGYEHLYDCCVLIVYCSHHERIALCNTHSSGGQYFRWFPFAHLSPTHTWHHVLMASLSIVLGQKNCQQLLSGVSCLNLFRIQLPRTQRFLTRMVFFVRFNPKLVDPCGTRNKVSSMMIEWFALKDAIQNRIPNVWGPEVSYYATLIEKNSQFLLMRKTIIEYDLRNAYSIYPFHQEPQNREEEMLLESKISEKDVERIYDDYLEHCFPCYFMNQVSFKWYMLKHGIELDQTRIQQYFNAFRYMEKSYMSFHELLIGLVAIDKNTPHCETRLKIIFRFYDIDTDGYLNMCEFRQLIQDLSSNITTPEMIDLKVNTILNQIKSVLLKGKQKIQTPLFNTEMPVSNGKDSNSTQEALMPRAIVNAQVGYRTFFNAVKCKILVGTSKLCRSQTWIYNTISRALITRRIQQTFTKNHTFRQVISNTRHEKCSSCMSNCIRVPYRMAHNVVYLTENRMFQKMVSLTFGEKKVLNNDNEKNLPKSNVVQISAQQHSLEVQYNCNSLPNLYINLIRDFSRNQLKGTNYDYKGLFDVVPSNLWEHVCGEIHTICKHIETLAEKEPHIVDLKSPAYVIGDIHGNIEDLLTLEINLWSTVPFISGNKYLFLGDYVDRGRWSFECVLYLFCLKMLAPDKVFLLRGNHEVRSVQNCYSYRLELLKKYGDEHGQHFFEWTNRVFDRLPCGAIIDNAIFAAHGGIPYSLVGQPIRNINEQVALVVSNPDLPEAHLIWEILWSDPAENKILREEFEFLTDFNRQDNENGVDSNEALLYKLYQLGYLPNRKRGTAFLFNEYALGTFLAVNNFSHMIRAHEVPLEGYRLNFRGRCVTIFSCSHYCGVENECAVAMLQDNCIRIVQLDTFNNSPATD